MHYMRSLQFIFDRQSWFTNVLLGGLCFLVPIIGPIVLTGYLYEVLDALQRDPDHKEYPDFDFNRLGDYVSRGVWPFLMQLVVSLIIAIPLGIVCAVLMGIGIAIAAASNSGAVMLLVQFVLFVVILVASILSALVTMPAELHGGLSREFNFGRMMAFVKAFNKLVAKEMLISILFIVAIAFVAELVGMALFCVGIYFTIAAVVMAQHHLEFQLYQLYLQRGGEPIIPAAGASRGRHLETDEPYPDEPMEPDERIRAGQ